MIGQRFSSWVVLSFDRRVGKSHKFWNCRCECGAEKSVREDSLKRGKTSTCKKCSNTDHGHTCMNGPHAASLTYESWSQMRSRCYCPTHKNWNNYGGRGISACERWEVFENFLSDMGERPKGTTLDRYPDNNGNYEPGNCRWATVKEQGQNTRTTKLNEEKVREIRAARGIINGRALARKYDVSPAVICAVQLFQTWTNIT